MLLAVDVGNTQTVFGLFEGGELGDRWRIATESQRTGDELGALLADFLDLGTVDERQIPSIAERSRKSARSAPSSSPVRCASVAIRQRSPSCGPS